MALIQHQVAAAIVSTINSEKAASFQPLVDDQVFTAVRSRADWTLKLSDSALHVDVVHTTPDLLGLAGACEDGRLQRMFQIRLAVRKLLTAAERETAEALRGRSVVAEMDKYEELLEALFTRFVGVDVGDAQFLANPKRSRILTSYGAGDMHNTLQQLGQYTGVCQWAYEYTEAFSRGEDVAIVGGG